MTTLTTEPGRAVATGVEVREPPPRQRTLMGLGALLRLLARRDRVRFALWFAAIVGIVVASAASIVGLYDTQADLESYARLVRGNDALVVQAGPGYGLDDPTLGAVVMNEVSIWTLVAMGLMSMFMVTRHTRAEEESGRAELVRAAPVGRHAPLAAAVIAVGLMNVMVAVGVTAGLLAYGLPVAGSIAFGAALVGAGWVFTGVTAVTAQVAAGARAATGLAGAVLGLSFVLRAVGDVGDGRLSWTSPLGWGQAIRAYADERWWVLLVPVVVTGGLVAVAVLLVDRRDLGAGLIADRPGRAEATPHLDSPLALATRLHRGAFVGWSVGMVIMSGFYGVVTDEAEQMIEENPDMADFFAALGQGTVTEAFIATSALMLALMCTGFTVATVLRLRTEETALRADTVLATPTSRARLAWSHLTVALVGTALLMAQTALAFGVGYAVVSAEPSNTFEAVVPMAVMVPAMWVVAGAAFALHAAAPRWSLGAWAFLALAVIVGFFGTVLDLPQWAMNLSPFEHVPPVPAGELQVAPIGVLLLIAAGLLAAGTRAFGRRDVG